MMETVTIANAETVAYAKGKEGLAFIQTKISQKREQVRTRAFLNTRPATAEEKALLEAYKAATLALNAFQKKTEITPLVVGSGITAIPVVSENFDTENVIGTRAEQVAAREAFLKQQKADLEAVDAIREELDLAYYTKTAGDDLSTALAAAVGKLGAINN